MNTDPGRPGNWGALDRESEAERGDEQIVPMSDEEIDKIENSPNCPVCGGDGADLEDSSKDCDDCHGTGLMSVYMENKERWKSKQARQ